MHYNDWFLNTYPGLWTVGQHLSRTWFQVLHNCRNCIQKHFQTSRARKHQHPQIQWADHKTHKPNYNVWLGGNNQSDWQWVTVYIWKTRNDLVIQETKNTQRIKVTKKHGRILEVKKVEPFVRDLVLEHKMQLTDSLHNVPLTAQVQADPLYWGLPEVRPRPLPCQLHSGDSLSACNRRTHGWFLMKGHSLQHIYQFALGSELGL